MSLVEALVRAGRLQAAEAACATAVELARALGDAALLARVALARGAEGTLGNADRPVVRLIEEALASLPSGDSPLRALVLARLASARQPEADPEPPMELARSALAMAWRLADDRVSLPVLHAALGALMDFAPAEERADLNAHALELATRLGDRPRAFQAAQRLAFDRLELADLDGFERALGHYEALAADVQQPRYGWVPVMFHSMRAEWEGDFERAAYCEREARRRREQGGGEGEGLVPARPLARALLKHDLAELARFTQALANQAPESAGARFLSAVHAAWQGNGDRARQVLEVLEVLGARGFGRFLGRASSEAPGAEPTLSSRTEENELCGLGYLQMPEIAAELASSR